MTDAEKWARVVIFILVGGYAILVLILTIRFVIRSCFSPRPDESNRWESFIAENIARRQRASEPPPKFDEAVSMKSPAPAISTLDIEDGQLPSYDEYVRRYSTDSHTVMIPPEVHSSTRQSNYSSNLMASPHIVPGICINCGHDVDKNTGTAAGTTTSVAKHGNGNC